MSSTIQKTFNIRFSDEDDIYDGSNGSSDSPMEDDIYDGGNSPMEDDDSAYLELELDSDRNSGDTSFAPGATVYLNVWRNPLAKYNMQTAAGKLKADGRGIPQDFVDIVNFINTSSESISQTPKRGSMSATWKGNNPGVTPLFSGRTVSVKKNIVAVLQCDYKGIKDRWMLFGVDEEMTVPVVVTMGGLESSVDITFEKQEDGEEEEIGLKVKNCETGEPVAAVSVWVSDQYQGATNSEGLINIGLRTIGDVLTVKWKKGDADGEAELTM